MGAGEQDRQSGGTTREARLTRRGLIAVGGRGALGATLMGGVLLGATGCSRSSSAGGSGGGADGAISSIGFDHPNNQIPLWEDIMRWSRVAARERDVKLLTTADEGKLDRQVANLNTWIAQRVPAIISYPLEPSAIEKIAERARARGIIWVTYAANLQNQDGAVLLNNVRSGELLGEAAARFVNERLGGRGKVLHLTFPDGGQIGRERDKGVVDALKRHAPGAEIVASQKAVDQATGLSVTSSVLSAHPDLNVVVGMNDDGAIGAYRAFLDRGRKPNDPKVFIGGQDGAKPALELIKRGTIYRATSALSIKELGEVCITFPLDIASGRVRRGATIDVPVHLLTADDGAKVDQLLSELSA
ncbi:sugar ABC transporter substrate-binding protein [Conexibacter arvalis]|uniref:Ribose transport system substrate-binding protein n=1 Tax=Conexibacter arvalis TaxID=912552 RepID=A0A840IKA7_9ACTN|nr:sugar ABC transporter substrate-binding protein [Conexibacter arvalis]MBB4664454.1 ribose transport system substrate-binding protein [Conexibacter arvalis]